MKMRDAEIYCKFVKKAHSVDLLLVHGKTNDRKVLAKAETGLGDMLVSYDKAKDKEMKKEMMRIYTPLSDQYRKYLS
jgi:hypothetical protein